MKPHHGRTGPVVGQGPEVQAGSIAINVARTTGRSSCLALKVLVVPDVQEHLDRLLGMVRDLLVRWGPRPAFCREPAGVGRSSWPPRTPAMLRAKDDPSIVPWTIISDTSIRTRTTDLLQEGVVLRRVLGGPRLPGATASAFTPRAVRFCNEAGAPSCAGS